MILPIPDAPPVISTLEFLNLITLFITLNQGKDMANKIPAAMSNR
jgi:hypothetical protein